VVVVRSLNWLVIACAIIYYTAILYYASCPSICPIRARNTKT